MSEYPRLPASTFRNLLPDGIGAAAAADVWKRLNRRASWLAQTRGHVSACWATHEVPTGVLTAVTTPADERILGDFLLPPLGTADGTFTIAVRVSGRTADCTLYGRLVPIPGVGVTSNRSTPFPSGRFELATITAGAITAAASAWDVAGSAWIYADTSTGAFVKSPDPTLPHLLRVSCNIAAAITVESIVAFAGPNVAIPDGDTAPTTFTKFSVTNHETADRPVDVSSLRRISRTLNIVAAKYPRALATHSYRPEAAIRTGAGVPVTNTDTADQVTARYLVRRGPQAGNCTLRVRADCTGGGGTPAGSIRVYLNNVQVAGSPVAVPTASAEAWYTIPIVTADGWSANTTHEVRIEAYAGYDVANWTMTVREIVLREDAYTESNFFVLSTARLDSVAPRVFRAAPDGLAAERPILATYRLTPNQDRWSDRATLARNALFSAQHRRSTLVADRLVTAPDTDAFATTDIGGVKAPSYVATMTTTEHVAGKDEGSCHVWVLTRRSGTLDSDVRPILVGYLDGTGYPSCTQRIGTPGETLEATTERRWRFLGSMPTTPGTTHALAIKAFWERIATGVIESTTGSGDAIAVEGICIYGKPHANQAMNAQYFYQAEAYTSSNAIPDNDVVTGLSKTIVVAAARAFTIDRLRVYVGVTHGTPTQLIYSLGNGTRTVTFRAAAHAGDTGTWWSDSTGGFIGDATPDAVLSAFIGDSSAGTWTLKVYDNAAGTTGTLTDFRLELW